MFKKGSTFEIDKVWIPKNTKTASFQKAAEELKIESDMPEDLVFSDDYVYSTVRAISARVNMNMDGFMREELLGNLPDWLKEGHKEGSIENQFGYRTFIGKNNHVDHYNQPEIDHGDNFLNAKHSPRGKILWAWYEEDPLEEEVRLGRGIDPVAKLANKDCWVKLLIANDRNKFPVLCRAIEDGIVTKVSMGAEVVGSTCSVCGKFAGAPWEYCDHIRYGRGQEFQAEPSSYFVTTGAVRELDPIVAFENNHGLQFFEESWILDIQADPTAVIMDLIRGEPGTALKSIGASKTAGQRDYKQILLDLINSESEMKESDIEKVSSILRKDAQNPNVNINIENIHELIDKNKYEEEMHEYPEHVEIEFDPRTPPHEQEGEFFPDLPFPCSARKEASDANPEYPLDPTIDIEVCQGCMYNRSPKVGAVDCSFPEVVREGGSDPLPPGFEAADSEGKEEPQTSGIKDEEGNEIKEFPGIEHPPRYNFDGKEDGRTAMFHILQSMLDVKQGSWKTSDFPDPPLGRDKYPYNKSDEEVDTFEHVVGISVPDKQISGEPVDPEFRKWLVNSIKTVMSQEFGGVRVKEMEGGWINRQSTEEHPLPDQGQYDQDNLTLIESNTDDLERGKSFVKDLAFSIEDALNQYAVQYFIDGKAFFTRDVH